MELVQSSGFYLEGRIISFSLSDNNLPKSLRLLTTEGEVSIKLSKSVRSTFGQSWRLGDWIRVWGKRKVKKSHLFTSTKTKLKAYQILTIASPSTTSSDSSERSRSPLPVPPSAPAALPSPKGTILVCQKSSCMKRGGKAMCQALETTLSDRALSEVKIKGTGCLKQCKAGPNMVIMPDKTRYTKVKAKEVPDLIAKHFPTPAPQPVSPIAPLPDPLPLDPLPCAASCHQLEQTVMHEYYSSLRSA